LREYLLILDITPQALPEWGKVTAVRGNRMRLMAFIDGCFLGNSGRSLLGEPITILVNLNSFSSNCWKAA
jgi:hypothetical protein